MLCNIFLASLTFLFHISHVYVILSVLCCMTHTHSLVKWLFCIPLIMPISVLTLPRASQLLVRSHYHYT